MLQEQDPLTKKLLVLIQSIQLKRGSGTLTATRSEGTSKEEGSIVFVKGQVTKARVGRYSGSEAFNRLTTWENCLFSFVSEQSSQGSDLQPPHTEEVERRPTTATESESPPSNQPLSSRPSRSSNNPQKPPMLLPLASKQSHSYKTAVPRSRSIRSLSLALKMIELAGLSRAHRRLFLLIDGNRSTDELASLIGYTSDEVTILLRDLEREHIILMPHVPS